MNPPFAWVELISILVDFQTDILPSNLLNSMNPIGSLGLGPVALEVGMGWVKGFHPRIEPGLASSRQPTMSCSSSENTPTPNNSNKEEYRSQNNDKYLCACITTFSHMTISLVKGREKKPLRPTFPQANCWISSFTYKYHVCETSR